MEGERDHTGLSGEGAAVTSPQARTTERSTEVNFMVIKRAAGVLERDINPFYGAKRPWTKQRSHQLSLLEVTCCSLTRRESNYLYKETAQ